MRFVEMKGELAVATGEIESFEFSCNTHPCELWVLWLDLEFGPVG